MSRIRLTIISFLITCVVANAALPHYFYGRLTSSNGLPETSISSVCQDSFGRTWVATRDGVFYYTGEKFVHLACAGSSLTSASVMMDADGCIWVTSLEVTGYFDIFTDTFTVIEDFAGISVLGMDVTPDGIVWLTTSDGVWKYSKRNGGLVQVLLASSFAPYRTCLTGDGNIAIVASNSNIYILDTNSGNVKSVQTDRPAASYSHIEYIGEDKALINDGICDICVVDLSTGRTESILDAGTFPDNAEVQCLLCGAGLYWIGTSNGILIYDPLTHSLEKQLPDELIVPSLCGENVRCLFCDSHGNVWAGTWSGGLRCWLSCQPGFSRFSSHGGSKALKGYTIRAVCEGPDGNIWIGSEEGFLSRFIPETQTFDDFSSAAGIAMGTVITDINRIGSLIWITTFGDGIISFDPVRGKIVRKYSLPNNNCMTVKRASDGMIYAGTRQGLYRLDDTTDMFESVDIVGNAFIHSFIEDNAQHLLLSTYHQGLGIYDIPTSSFRKVQAAQQDAMTSLMRDSRGIIWATTDGSGICKIEFSRDFSSETVKHFDKQSGLPSNSCSSITEDEAGHLWVATTMGLVEFDPVAEKVIHVYMQSDNIIGRNFTFGGNCKRHDGLMFLGTTEGLLQFVPEYVKDRFGHSRIYITDITIGSASEVSTVSQSGRSAITSQTIHVRRRDAGLITLTFSPLDFSSPIVGKYECSLAGRGVSNHFVTDESHVVYSGLAPGSYDFTVNYDNSADMSTAAQLNIVVLAPWYFSIVAKILYILVLAALTYFFCKRRHFLKEEETRQRMELVEAKREKDLAHEKMAFYTNIAHEIRTPVSVLQILVDKIDSEHQIQDYEKEDMKSLHLNVDRLKKLCDDLLNFRKMDKGQVHLALSSEDLCTIMRKAFISFESAAKSRNLDLKVEYSKDSIISSCNADAVESIICNLLSNSIKYSSSHIDCKVYEVGGNAAVRIENDGARIPDEEKDLIFEPFFQSKSQENNGTGLGLTYSRKVASLLNGRLYLDTDVKDLNSFVLELPLNNAAAELPENVSSSQTEIDLPTLDSGKRTILVVEDNEMMRNLIRDALAKDYTILTAQDGEEAMAIVKASHVDLLVSDIMMPKMDGCELCNAIKEDINFSHIPVLLLTAAVGEETHIRSLKSGADAYLEKPFKMDILKANISNLLRNRDIRNEQFSSSPLSHFSFSSVSKVEIDFMNSLHSYIMDHISDTNISLDHLAEAMSVSRATLTRKVKADTGVTVNEYVRICRLKKAVELLAENNYRINEVAYLVGFSSPSYFTSSFQKQFGKLPSEFAKKKTK